MRTILETYLQRLIDQFRRLDSRGVMQVARIIELDLLDVFVPLKLRVGAEDDRNEIIFAPTEAGRDLQSRP